VRWEWRTRQAAGAALRRGYTREGVGLNHDTIAATLAEIQELLKRLDGLWGRFRGGAVFYMPYWVHKDGWAVQASAKVTYFHRGGNTMSGLAEKNLDPNTVEVAEKNLLEYLLRDQSLRDSARKRNRSNPSKASPCRSRSERPDIVRVRRGAMIASAIAASTSVLQEGPLSASPSAFCMIRPNARRAARRRVEAEDLFWSRWSATLSLPWPESSRSRVAHPGRWVAVPPAGVSMSVGSKCNGTAVEVLC
jgi:hypothetical protein